MVIRKENTVFRKEGEANTLPTDLSFSLGSKMLADLGDDPNAGGGAATPPVETPPNPPAPPADPNNDDDPPADPPVDENTEQLQQIISTRETILAKDENERSEVETKFLADTEGVSIQSTDTPSTLDGINAEYSLGIEGTFKDDQDGIKDFVDKALPKLGQSALANTFATNPEFKAFWDHTKEGGTIATFKLEQQSQQVKDLAIQNPSELEGDDKQAAIDKLKAVIKTDLSLKNIGEQYHESIINGYEDEGIEKLYSEANNSKTSASNALQKIANDKKAEQKIINDKIIADQQAMIKAIDDNDFDGIKIPQNHLTGLKKDLTTKGQDGRLLIEAKYNNLSPAKQALLDYFVYSDFKDLNLEGIIKDTGKKFDIGNFNRDAYKDLLEGNSSVTPKKQISEEELSKLTIDYNNINKPKNN